MMAIRHLTLVLALLAARVIQAEAGGLRAASESLEDSFEDDRAGELERNLQFMPPTPSPETMNEPYAVPPLPDKLSLDYDPANPYVVVKAGGDEVMSWFAAHDYCRDELHSELASVDKVDTATFGSQTEQIVALDTLCKSAIQDYETVESSYVCHIGLKFDLTTDRFKWENGQLLAPTAGQRIPPDTVVSDTNFGYSSTTLADDELGMGDAPSASELDDSSQWCVSTRFWGKNARKGWINSRCATHSSLYDKAAFICKNPFFGIDSCASSSDCGDNGDCANGQCVPSASIVPPGRTCDTASGNLDCPVDPSGNRITCTDEGYCLEGGCSEDSDCSTGACLSGTCVEQDSVVKGGYCDSDAECMGSAICNLKVNRCDSRAAKGIKLSYCSEDSHCNQNGIKWSVCSPTRHRCETPVGGWCTFNYYCVSDNCDTSIKRCVS